MACVYVFRHGKENKFKIGRTKKSTKLRLKELQTGNPYLTFFDTIDTNFDSAVEKYIHRRLATKKIINGSASDEFYAVSVDDLQPIIIEARDYSSECLPTVEQAREVAAEAPDGSVKEPGNSDIAIHQELLKIEEQMALLDSRVDYLVSELKIGMGAASELRGIATWNAITSKRLDSTALKEELPDVYEKYLKTSTSRTFKLEK